jgi:hypothetical protein
MSAFLIDEASNDPKIELGVCPVVPLERLTMMM